jgi:hypothetical protein
VPASQGDTTTRDHPARPEAYVIHCAAVAAANERHGDLLDDLTIAVQILQRDLADTGERISLDAFLHAQGYDEAEFEH